MRHKGTLLIAVLPGIWLFFSQLLNKYEYLHGINLLIPKYLDRDLQRLFNRFFRFLKEGGHRRI